MKDIHGETEDESNADIYVGTEVNDDVSYIITKYIGDHVKVTGYTNDDIIFQYDIMLVDHLRISTKMLKIDMKNLRSRKVVIDEEMKYYHRCMDCGQEWYSSITEAEFHPCFKNDEVVKS